MIVGKYYVGHDLEVAWKQHDIYYEALAIIVSTCNRHINWARSLLHTSECPEWGTVDEYDHRTLQYAHDLLAAVWSSRNDFRQSSLLLDDKRTLEEVQTLWLAWLREEIWEWNTQPHLVRAVQLILTNQNQRCGYAAEAQLQIGIIDRFPNVPWEREILDVYESSLRKHNEKQKFS